MSVIGHRPVGSGMLMPKVHKASCALLHHETAIVSLILICFFIIVGFSLFNVPTSPVNQV